MTNLSSWDFVNVRDFEYLNKLFEAEQETFELKVGSTDVQKCYKTGYIWDKDSLLIEIIKLGNSLRKNLGLEIAELDPDQSKFYKAAQYNTPRMNKMFTEEELNNLRKINK